MAIIGGYSLVIANIEIPENLRKLEGKLKEVFKDSGRIIKISARWVRGWGDVVDISCRDPVPMEEITEVIKNGYKAFICKENGDIVVRIYEKERRPYHELVYKMQNKLLKALREEYIERGETDADGRGAGIKA